MSQDEVITSPVETTHSARPLRSVGEKKHGFWWGTGRRKQSVARVRIHEGGGNILVNGKDYQEYFCNEQDRLALIQPLQASQNQAKFDVLVAVKGGGITGQAGAVRMGLSRALLEADPVCETVLRSGNFLTRDSRMKERKKYGQRGARRRFQFSKR